MPADSSRQNSSCSAPVRASAPFSAGPRARVRTIAHERQRERDRRPAEHQPRRHRPAPTARGALANAPASIAVYSVARALAAEAHRERALARAPVGVDVPHVVHHQDRARQQPHGHRAAERLPGQRLHLDEVGARRPPRSRRTGTRTARRGPRTRTAAGPRCTGRPRGSTPRRPRAAPARRPRPDRPRTRTASPNDTYVATSTWRGGTSPPAVTLTGPSRSSLSAPRRASE